MDLDDVRVGGEVVDHYRCHVLCLVVDEDRRSVDVGGDEHGVGLWCSGVS